MTKYGKNMTKNVENINISFELTDYFNIDACQCWFRPTKTISFLLCMRCRNIDKKMMAFNMIKLFLGRGG